MDDKLETLPPHLRDLLKQRVSDLNRTITQILEETSCTVSVLAELQTDYSQRVSVRVNPSRSETFM